MSMHDEPTVSTVTEAILGEPERLVRLRAEDAYGCAVEMTLTTDTAAELSVLLDEATE